MSDTAYSEVVQRMATDPGFAATVAANPSAVLDGLDLSREEREMLAALTSDGGAGANRLGTRQSKSAMLPMSFLGAHPVVHTPPPTEHLSFGDHATGLPQPAAPDVAPHATSGDLDHGVPADPTISGDQKVESLSDMGGSEDLKNQAALEQLSKTEAAIGNIEHQISQTSQEIIQNMK